MSGHGPMAGERVIGARAGHLSVMAMLSLVVYRVVPGRYPDQGTRTRVPGQPVLGYTPYWSGYRMVLVSACRPRLRPFY